MLLRDKRRWLRWLAELFGLALIFLLVNAWHTRATVHGVAPEVRGVLLDGTPVSLQALRGQPVLLHFWATWCPICGLEQGSIESLSRDYTVLTIAIDSSSSAAVRSWLGKKGLHYPVLHDPDGRIASRYGIRGVPASFIIDPSGNIRFAEVGYTSGIGLRLRLWWAARYTGT